MIEVSEKAKALVEELDRAAQEFAFIGSYHPDTHAEVTHQYEAAREELFQYIAELEK